jgi:hypothetical protein
MEPAKSRANVGGQLDRHSLAELRREEVRHSRLQQDPSTSTPSPPAIIKQENSVVSTTIH